MITVKLAHHSLGINRSPGDELWLLDLDANPAADASRWRSMVSGAAPSGRQYHVAVLDPEGRMWLHNGDLGWIQWDPGIQWHGLG